VSFDPPEANAKFVAKYDFPFPILSDTDKSMAIAYGAAADASAKYANRVTVVIDKDGRVETLYGKVDPKTHAATLLDAVPAPPGGK
jgi:peroxiredoxin Q/BCP